MEKPDQPLVEQSKPKTTDGQTVAKSEKPDIKPINESENPEQAKKKTSGRSDKPVNTQESTKEHKPEPSDRKPETKKKTDDQPQVAAIKDQNGIYTLKPSGADNPKSETSA